MVEPWSGAWAFQSFQKPLNRSGASSVKWTVLDILVPKPSLQRPRVVAGIGQGIAAAVPKHVRVNRQRHLGPHPDPGEQGMECLGRHRPAPLSHKDVRGGPLFAL
jgi:hypothetical protein